MLKNNDANANISLELRVENINCIGDLRMKLLKSFYNGCSIQENYINRRCELHVHGVFDSSRFCLTYKHLSGRGNYRKSPVFVRVGNLSETPRPVTSIARLIPADKCNMVIVETSKIDIPSFAVNGTNSTYKTLAAIFDRELCVLHDLLGVKLCQLIDEIVKGRPEIVDNLTSEDTNHRVDVGISAVDYPTVDVAPILTLQQFPHHRIILEANSIFLEFTEPVVAELQVFEVFSCPFDPLLSAIQRLHMLYYPQGETNATKEAKDSQRVRDTRSNTQRRVQGTLNTSLRVGTGISYPLGVFCFFCGISFSLRIV